MLAYFWVGLGGALGSMLRFWLSILISRQFGETFPWGILAINVMGSFVIGVLAAFTNPDGPVPPSSRIFATQFLMIGLCGGFTTFSSFSRDTLRLLQDRQWLFAGGNVMLSVALCLLAVWLGYFLGSFATQPRQ